jgi:hypothetical protein
MNIREKVEKVWDQQGDCESCHWHALLSEYWLTDKDFDDCVKDGIFRLPCLSKDSDGSSHRGISIDIR